MLDLHLHLPKELLRYDIEVRKWLLEHLHRGQITIRIYLRTQDLLSKSYLSSLATFKQLKQTWEKLAFDLGYDATQEVTLSFLAQQLHTLSEEQEEEEEDLKDLLKKAVHQAMQGLIQMKEKEGIVLLGDIERRLKSIEENLSQIQILSDGAVVLYREKLIERVAKILPPSTEWDERLMREVALMAEKLDITEEQIRLQSHIVQFRDFLASHEKSIGRTLDFLIQEMNREINTIASKSDRSEIAHLAVSMKTELEKIREQIQNIE
jgi:uncharacterized protein (TIGR00255 family)